MIPEVFSWTKCNQVWIIGYFVGGNGGMVIGAPREGGVNGGTGLTSGTMPGFSSPGDPSIGMRGSPLGGPSWDAPGSAVNGFPTLRLFTTSTTPIVREATSMARSRWFAESTYPVSSICPGPLISAWMEWSAKSLSNFNR